MGQPTHFLTGRQYGMFAILVPKDFGNKKLTWTINANGHKTIVTFWLNPQYWIEFFKNTANENEPPRIKFAMAGPEYIGPPREKIVATLDRDRRAAARPHGVGRRSTADAVVRRDAGR